MTHKTQGLESRVENDRSQGKRKIAGMLDAYDIPFIYEMPTTVYTGGQPRIWHPDFTLPDHGGLIVEYAGMPDVADYMASIRHKQKTYQANGLGAVFMYPKDLRGNCWQDHLYDRLTRAADDYQRSTTLARYTREEP